jgi:hypothetical protein
MSNPWLLLQSEQRRYQWRVDRDEVALRLDVDNDPVRSGVVLRVADVARERDGCDPTVRVRVDDGIGIAMLVRDVQLVAIRHERHPVWIRSGGHAGDDLQRTLVDDGDLVGSGSARIDPIELRDGEDAVDFAQVGDRLDDAIRLCVDHDHLARAEVRDEQEVSLRVEAFIVEARRTTCQWDVGDGLQGQFLLRREHDRS